MAVDIQQFIRQEAIARGIDPDIALRVARGEGGFSNPYQQSNIVKNGVREPSFGPFQLYMNGGMGNQALAAGIDPRKDWQGGVKFALDQAKQGGWGPWYGAKAAGITGMEGIGGTPGTAITSTPGSPAPPLPPPTTIQDHPVAEVAAATDPAAKPSLLDTITKLSTGTGTDGTGPSPLGALAKTMSPKQPEVDNIIPSGALAASESADATRMASAQQMMAQLLQKRKQVPGMGLGGLMMG